MMRFNNKVVVVTGGGSGIGLAAVKLFAAEGATVAINDNRSETAEAAVREVESAGGRAMAVPGDVSDEAQVRQNVSQILDRYGHIDVLLANAGLPNLAPAEIYTAWRRSVGVNLDGAFYWAQTVARQSMLPRESGAIIFTSSLAGLAANTGDGGYVSSKHAIIGLTKALAAEWALYGVRVNCVAPGLTDSLMMQTYMGTNPEIGERIGRIPMGRLGKPEEQARTMLFLASDDASYITGQTIAVDGGQMSLHSGLSGGGQPGKRSKKASD